MLYGPYGARCELSFLSSRASINTDRQLKIPKPSTNSKTPSLSLSSFGPHKRPYTRRQIRAAELTPPPPPFAELTPLLSPPLPPLFFYAAPSLLHLGSVASSPPSADLAADLAATAFTTDLLIRRPSQPPNLFSPLLSRRTTSSAETDLISRRTTSSAETLTDTVRTNLPYRPYNITAETLTYTARTTFHTDRIASLPVPVTTLYGPYNPPYGPYRLI